MENKGCLIHYQNSCRSSRYGIFT